jgi:hypothetical protein
MPPCFTIHVQYSIALGPSRRGGWCHVYYDARTTLWGKPLGKGDDKWQSSLQGRTEEGRGRDSTEHPCRPRIPRARGHAGANAGDAIGCAWEDVIGMPHGNDRERWRGRGREL